MNLGERIKACRKVADLTQAALAKKLQLSLPTLNKYERGRRIPDSAILAEVSKISGCDPGWILTGEGSMRHAEKPPPETGKDMAAQALAWSNGDERLREIINLLSASPPEDVDLFLRMLKHRAEGREIQKLMKEER